MFYRKLLPALLWALFILVLCGIPGNKIPELTFWQWLKPDKIVHLLIFGVQCYLLLYAFNTTTAPLWLNRHAALLALLLTIGYGGLTEILQTFVFINRYGDVRDALANALGAVAGCYFYRKKIKVRKQ
jgi:VanZ family protein